MPEDNKPFDSIFLAPSAFDISVKQGYRAVPEAENLPSAAQRDCNDQQKLKRINKVNDLKQRWKANAASAALLAENQTLPDLPQLEAVADTTTMTFRRSTDESLSDGLVDFPTLLEVIDNCARPSDFVWPKAGVAINNPGQVSLSIAPIKPEVFNAPFELHAVIHDTKAGQPDWRAAQIQQLALVESQFEHQQQLFKEYTASKYSNTDMQLGSGLSIMDQTDF